MNYQFYHECDAALLQQLKIVAGKNYVLVCFGMHNYFFTDRDEISIKVRGLLFTKGVIVSPIPNTRLKDVVKKALEDTKITVIGNKKLLEKFRGD